MLAIHLTAFGDPLEVLKCVEIAEPPDPGKGEILIQMEFSPVNTSDLLLAKGVYAVRPELPSVIGNEGAGIVIGVGGAVLNVKIGDRVLVSQSPFAWAERLVAPADKVFVLPDGVDLAQASMLSINTATASLLLSDVVGLKAGDWVAQNAANSGVGRSVIAIAKAKGLRTVNLVRRPELVQDLLDSGADVVFVNGPDLAQQVKGATNGQPIKLGLDGVGGSLSAALGAVLTERGVIVNYAAMSGQPVAVDAPDLVFKRLLLRGFFMYHPEFSSSLGSAVTEGARLLAANKLHVPVAAEYALNDITKAVAHLQAGGKVLLNMGGDALNR